MRDCEFLVPEDDAIGAGIYKLALAFGLHGIDDNQAIFALIYRVGCGFHAWGVVAVLAAMHHIGYLHLGNLPSNDFFHGGPKMPSIRLRFSIGEPFVVDMLVLAC